MNYECHITTTVADAGKAEEIAKEFNWKTSEIKRDPLLGDGSHFYLTAHHTSFNQMFAKMRGTADLLRARGCTVLREKIEAIIYDTKTGTVTEHVGLEPPVGVVQTALNALQANHEWHKAYDDYDGYDDSNLCKQNTEAISQLNAMLLPQAKGADEFAENNGGRSKFMAEPTLVVDENFKVDIVCSLRTGQLSCAIIAADGRAYKGTQHQVLASEAMSVLKKFHRGQITQPFIVEMKQLLNEMFKSNPHYKGCHVELVKDRP